MLLCLTTMFSFTQLNVGTDLRILVQDTYKNTYYKKLLETKAT